MNLTTTIVHGDRVVGGQSFTTPDQPTLDARRRYERIAGLPWRHDDGGRAAAGYRGETSDCVVRAIAIATGVPYKTVYDELYLLAGTSPRNGVLRKHYQRYLFDLGWLWHGWTKVGSGTVMHLRAGEFPNEGRYIARCSRHICAVIDGTVHDINDPSRSGQRAVYGWYEPGANAHTPTNRRTTP